MGKISQWFKDLFKPDPDAVDTTNLPRHPRFIAVYLLETGEWHVVIPTTPVKIEGKFVADEPVERRLRTWVQTQDAWGPCKQQRWADFEYRKVNR